MSVLLLVLSACNTVEPECSESVACDFGAICVDGQCLVQSCSTSAQCPMEHFCDRGGCTPGCADDVDCYPGDACNTALETCEQKECRDTRLDCGYKQWCNELTGDCYDASGYYCRECNGDADCGGNGNYCYNGYCGVTCATDTDCPSGFSCLAFVDNSGNVQFYQCYTYCWLYEDAVEQGADLPRPVVPPAADPICVEGP